MFQKQSEKGYVLIVPGIERKTLVYGEKTLMTEFVLKKGNRLPQHSHPHEQTGYLVKGWIRLSIGTEQQSRSLYAGSGARYHPAITPAIDILL